MATQIDNSFRTFSFASAISANTLVSISGANAAAAANSAANAIGVVQEDVSAADVGSVKLFYPTQFGIVSSGPVTAGSDIFAITNGFVGGTLLTSSVTLGVAIQSGVNGDVIEYAVKR